MKIINSRITDPKFPCPFLIPRHQILFVDIETTGLSPKASSLYLIGVMHCTEQTATQSPHDETASWEMIQWFADDYQSEPEILRSFLDYMEAFQSLWHFNGAMFDIPYILSKCEKHGITPSPHCMTLFQERYLDLLREIRPLKKKLQIDKANQTALEHWLGIARLDPYDGGELISVYTEYMQAKILHPEQAESLQKTLLLHNHDDMAGMLEICSILSYAKALSPHTPPAVTEYTLSTAQLTVRFTLPCPVPRRVVLHHSFNGVLQDIDASLCLEDLTGILTLPLYRGTLKLFFEPARDYFYLPAEDTAIHKSVAQFVDPAFREKAKASNCYTKKEGIFFPSLSKKALPDAPPAFYEAYRAKPACYLWEDSEPNQQKDMLAQYLLRELPFFAG